VLRNVNPSFAYLQRVESGCFAEVSAKYSAHLLMVQVSMVNEGLSFWSEVEPSGLLTRPLIGPMYQPRMMDDDECGAVGGMSDRGNRSNRRKQAPVPLCPPQIPHYLTRI
jgi:hypothetical protein